MRIDHHAERASLIFQVPVEEVTPEMRRIGKCANFVDCYSSGPEPIKSMADKVRKNFPALKDVL